MNLREVCRRRRRRARRAVPRATPRRARVGSHSRPHDGRAFGAESTHRRRPRDARAFGTALPRRGGLAPSRRPSRHSPLRRHSPAEARPVARPLCPLRRRRPRRAPAVELAAPAAPVAGCVAGLPRRPAVGAAAGAEGAGGGAVEKGAPRGAGVEGGHAGRYAGGCGRMPPREPREGPQGVQVHAGASHRSGSPPAQTEKLPRATSLSPRRRWYCGDYPFPYAGRMGVSAETTACGGVYATALKRSTGPNGEGPTVM